jgi:transmembrane sensor
MFMENDKFVELAVKNISGEITSEEKIILNNLLNEQFYSEQYEDIRAKWYAVNPDENEKLFDKREGWEILNNKITEYEPEFGKKKAASKFVSPVLLKIAASLLVVIFSSGILLFTGVLNKKGEPVRWIEKSAQTGEKLLITLADSTVITLNADSKLKYPEGFTAGQREVFLEGEAYFEVAHDSSKPFLVHAQGTVTRVLGTVFNVSAYGDADEVNIALISGKVRVSAENSSEGVLLKPMQKLLFSKEDENSVVEVFDLQKETGWKNNVFVFDNEPLEKVLKQLERNYGVKLELQDSSLKDKKIKANFKNESLATVIEVIKKSMQLKAKIEKKNNQITKVVFYKN